MGRTTVILLLGIFFLGTAFRVCTICRFCICIVFFRGVGYQSQVLCFYSRFLDACELDSVHLSLQGFSQFILLLYLSMLHYSTISTSGIGTLTGAKKSLRLTTGICHSCLMDKLTLGEVSA
jgi:hypothetical protein